MRTRPDIPPSFKLIFHVAFEHAGFADGAMRAMRIVPVIACHEMLLRAGMRIRCQDDGVAAYGDAAAVKRLRLHIAEAGGPLQMAFQVFFTDPDFFDYTAPRRPAGQVLFLDTADSSVDAGGRQMLHATPCVPASAYLARDHADLVRILGERELPPTPAMVLQVSVSAHLLETSRASERAYHVRFAASAAATTAAATAAASSVATANCTPQRLVRRSRPGRERLESVLRTDIPHGALRGHHDLLRLHAHVPAARLWV